MAYVKGTKCYRLFLKIIWFWVVLNPATSPNSPQRSPMVQTTHNINTTSPNDPTQWTSTIQIFSSKDLNELLLSKQVPNTQNSFYLAFIYPPYMISNQECWCSKKLWWLQQSLRPLVGSTSSPGLVLRHFQKFNFLGMWVAYCSGICEMYTYIGPDRDISFPVDLSGCPF